MHTIYASKKAIFIPTHFSYHYICRRMKLIELIYNVLAILEALHCSIVPIAEIYQMAMRLDKHFTRLHILFRMGTYYHSHTNT